MCLLKVLCPVRRPITTRDCVLLKDNNRALVALYKGADKSLARPGRKQATATEDGVSYILFIIIIGGILVLDILYIYI
jgi:hypothetical protein